MPKYSRNLLLIAALCWVAPVSAELPGNGDKECYRESASSEVLIVAEHAPSDVALPAGHRALLP